MNRAHGTRGYETLGFTVEPDDRFPAAFVRYADEAPRNRVTERFTRCFLRREESGETFGPVTLAHRIRHFFFRINLARKPRQLAFIESIALDLGEVDPDAYHHSSPFAPFEEFSGSACRSIAPEMESRIRIVPINTVDGAFLDRLGPCLEERFLCTVDIERALAVPRTALNATRQQLFLSTLFTRVRRAHPEGGAILLALTDFDLYKTSHRFIYGDADETQAMAAVSLHRLRSEYYGEEPDSNILFQRTLKECVHELGHAFGLKHCYNGRCAMYYSNSIFETDNKMSHFCETCDRRIARARNER